MKRHLLILLVIVLAASMVLIVAGFKKADETTSTAASNVIASGSETIVETEDYIMNSDGSNIVKDTDYDAYNWWPFNSPDGSKIVFEYSRDGKYEIYVSNPDRSNEVRLTDNDTDDVSPAWSPDGSKIVFSRRQVVAPSGVAPSGFRPAGPLVPEITTYIPTPLNLSPKPTVIGTNLLLAALTMLLFAVAAELFTRTLTKNEEVLKRKMRPAAWLSRMQKRIEAIMGTKMGRHLIARDIVKLLGVILFYGLAFSLLDRTWKPFSLTGLVLFLNMTIAYGIVGLAGDIMQWRALKKWGISKEIGIRPTNVLISVISISASRLVGIVPGLMFGTPQALRVDESTLDKAKRNRLLKISAITLLVISFGLWLPTIATSFIQRLSLPGTLVNLIGGFEGFLLIIFAVALENTFIQMLGFPGGFGRALKQKNRWLWFGGLVVITFIFYHTLINPRGELVEALQETNVILFLSIAVAFIIIAFGLWLYFRRKWQIEEPKEFKVVEEVPEEVKQEEQ